MKRTRCFLAALSILIATLLGMGCSTGNSGSNDDDDTSGTNDYIVTSAGLTLSDIAGTWINVLVHSGDDYTRTNTTTLTINTNGAFIMLVTKKYDGSSPTITLNDRSAAYKGTVSIDSDGIVSFAITETYHNDNAIVTNLSGVTWEPDTIYTSSTIVMVNGSFYTNAFKRQGTGSGIKGTWVADYNDDGERFKVIYSIGDSTVDYKLFSGVYPFSEGIPEESIYYDSYNISEGKLKLYMSGSQREEHDLLLTDEYLALDSKYVKQ